MKKSAILTYFFVVMLSSSCAQRRDNSINLPKTVDFTVEQVVPNIQNPWGMAFLPNGSILITEKAGKLYHFINGNTVQISGLPEIYVRGQGGFMDIELHPNYSENG